MRDNFHSVVCEDWKQRPVKEGGLGGHEIEFIGDDLPLPHDQVDICNNMNRSDFPFDGQDYWLYEDADAKTGDKVQLWRGMGG